LNLPSLLLATTSLKGNFERLGFGSPLLFHDHYYHTLFLILVSDFFQINAAKSSEEVFEAVRVLFASET